MDGCFFPFLNLMVTVLLCFTDPVDKSSSLDDVLSRPYSSYSTASEMTSLDV